MRDRPIVRKCYNGGNFTLDARIATSFLHDAAADRLSCILNCKVEIITSWLNQGKNFRSKTVDRFDE